MARLEWDAEREGCMGADRFGDEVAARVGRIVFDDEAPATVRVVVGEEEGEATVRIEMRGTWSTDEGRNTRVALRVFRDAACDEALEAAAAALAVWIDEPPAETGGVAIGEGGEPIGALALEGASEEPTGVAGGRELRGVGGLGVGRQDGRVRLRASSNQEGLTLHRETNTGRGEIGARYFERLCILPCETRIRPGVQQFGLAFGNGIARPLPELTEIREDSELFVNVRPASPWNLTGRWLVAASLLLVTPVSLIVTGVKRDDWGDAPFFASIGISA
ncbi:MAG TPA: hypothetical protein RMH80_18550, partial [Polyangiaceae bacterium LLY-WYZ-15_(1-7)]|nr:hypothetical protein [Polyangiaceae bacterium LLY-WYZ-15_(1-7)]